LELEALIGRNKETVIQEEATGCGIAASAALAGVSYAEAKRSANALGIYAADTALWSETEHVPRLLRDSVSQRVCRAWHKPYPD